MSHWFRRFFEKKSDRFSDKLLKAQESDVDYVSKWAKRLMRISRKVTLNKAEQDEVFHIVLKFYKMRKKLKSELPHLPEMLEREIKIIEIKRDLALREILEYRFEDYKDWYSRYS